MPAGQGLAGHGAADVHGVELGVPGRAQILNPRAGEGPKLAWMIQLGPGQETPGGLHELLQGLWCQWVRRMVGSVGRQEVGKSR